MIQTIKIDTLKCDCLCIEGVKAVTYMIYPAVGSIFPPEWIEKIASTYRVSIAMIYVPADEWDDILTPWPAPADGTGSHPFAGKGAEFLTILQNKVIPACDKLLKINNKTPHDLIGVSLSGLFTLWQWILCDSFRSIASLSGSFWYPGFLEWFDRQSVPDKTGKAYFLLGKKEPHAAVKAYRSVGVNTEAVVSRLKSVGIDLRFDWVPGAHIDNPLPRAEKAFEFLYC